MLCRLLARDGTSRQNTHSQGDKNRDVSSFTIFAMFSVGFFANEIKITSFALVFNRCCAVSCQETVFYFTP